MFSTAAQKAKEFLHAPFQQPLDAVHVFLVVGLVLVAIIAWTRILAYFPSRIELE